MRPKGVVLFSPYPRFNRKTYRSAARLLSSRDDCEARLVEKLEALPGAVSDLATVCEKVLCVSHTVLPLESTGECTFENVFFYGGQTIQKSAQFRLLAEHGIPIPRWCVRPQDASAIFAVLGDLVVAKPNEYGGFRSRLVHLVRPGEPIAHLDRWVFTEYVGEKEPPFRKGRVNAMFGVPIVAYEVINRSEAGRIWGLGTEDVLCATTEGGMIEMCCHVSRLMSEEFGCGMVGVDVVFGRGQMWVLEANTTTIALSGAGGANTAYDPSLNPGAAIAHACLEQLETLR